MFQILVVEDDRELRELFCAVLAENGYTALPAVDGLEAFDVLEARAVSLVISDVMMPRMDGFQMVKALREAGYTHAGAADYRPGERRRQAGGFPGRNGRLHGKAH